MHHVGSASPRIVAELAARHPDSKVPTDPEALADYFTFTDFAHFIDVYLSVVDLIRTPEDVRLLTYEVARDLARQQVRYAELTVTPFSSTRRGIDEPGLHGRDRGRPQGRRGRVRDRAALVLRHPRRGRPGGRRGDHPARHRRRLRPEGLVAFGLGGPEIGVPRPQFKPYFDRAIARRAAQRTARRETTGPETVWDALTDLRAERIGHGTSAAQDPKLLAHLAEHRIAAGGVPDLQHRHPRGAHPRRAPDQGVVAAGVLVTINSDDPPMFGTDLNNEYAVAARLLDLDERGLAELAKNAVEASFLDAAGKARTRRDRHVHRLRRRTVAPLR